MPIPAAPAAYREAFVQLEKQEYEAALKGFSDFYELTRRRIGRWRRSWIKRGATNFLID